MESKLTAMTTFIAASVLIGLFAAVIVLLERNHHRTAGMPHAPYGGTGAGDLDLFRVLHDLAARGR